MISVSFLKSKYSREETIKLIDTSDASLIHVDLMDGEYVPEKNFTLEEIMTLLNKTKKPLDIHLMVKNPLIYIKELVKLKPYIITIHLDSTPNIEETLAYIRNHDIKVGVAINPDESEHIVDKYIDKIDYVLIMSVYPGAGGQKFIPKVLEKVNYLKDKFLVGIDGGINDESIKYLKDYPLDIVVSGSFICMSDNFNERINLLEKNLPKA